MHNKKIKDQRAESSKQFCAAVCVCDVTCKSEIVFLPRGLCFLPVCMIKMINITNKIKGAGGGDDKKLK